MEKQHLNDDTEIKIGSPENVDIQITILKLLSGLSAKEAERILSHALRDVGHYSILSTSSLEITST